VGSRTESEVCADGELMPLNVNQLEYHATTELGGSHFWLGAIQRRNLLHRATQRSELVLKSIARGLAASFC